MILVGELLNTSRQSVARAVEARDEEFVRCTARRQADAGAHYIDVNAGTLLDGEAEALGWMVDTVQCEVDLPLCLDSPNPASIAAVVGRCRREPLLNSISLERDRFDAVLPLLASGRCRVVALCMTETAMPNTTNDRILAAVELVSRLTDAGVDEERIFVDPLVQPVSVDTAQGPTVLEAVAGVRAACPGANIVVGLSNISFGLPRRSLLNRTFLAMAMGRGLTAAICDPTDRTLTSILQAAEVLLNQDEFCESFLDAFQEGTLNE